MENYTTFLIELFQKWGASYEQAFTLNSIVIISLIIIASWFSNWLTKNVIVVIVKRAIKNSRNEYDDVFVKRKVFDHLSHIVPAIIIYFTIPYAIIDEEYYTVLQSLTYIYVIVAVLLVLNQFLNALNEIFNLIAQKKQLNVSIKGYIQVVKITFIIVSIILIVAEMLGKKPGAIFAGLGAMTAVLMLIFKDTILGFVASIQLSAYKMLKVGDWISVSSRNADGNVIDISLSTVKVQNFDKTISTIPTYALVSESFTNWDGMVSSGGRRIKRSINIDINSIKFCTQELINKLKEINCIKDFVIEKENELNEWNKKNNIDNSILVNSKRLTNLGVFCVYIENYLKENFRSFKKIEKQTFINGEHITEKFVVDDKEKFIQELGNRVKHFLYDIDGKTVIVDIDKFLIEYSDKFIFDNNRIYYIKKNMVLNINRSSDSEVEKIEKIIEKDGLFCDDMMLLVRQLDPTETGVPIQILVFAATTNSSEFELIQSNLFEHIFAILPEFDLKMFQRPSGSDFYHSTQTS